MKNWKCVWSLIWGTSTHIKGHCVTETYSQSSEFAFLYFCLPSTFYLLLGIRCCEERWWWWFSCTWWLKKICVTSSICGCILKIKKACFGCIDWRNGVTVKPGRWIPTLTLWHPVSVEIKTVGFCVCAWGISCRKVCTHLFGLSCLIQFSCRDDVQRSDFLLWSWLWIKPCQDDFTCSVKVNIKGRHTQKIYLWFIFMI